VIATAQDASDSTSRTKPRTTAISAEKPITASTA
jgi:hypothetical protein